MKAGARETVLREGRRHRWVVGLGLVCYGIIHLLIAGITVRVAWSGHGDASGQGALHELAQTRAGTVVLWVVVAGLVVLSGWQALEAAIGHRDKTGRRRVRRRLSSAGRAVVYLGLALGGARSATGGARTGDRGEEALTAQLLAVPFGRVLVVAVGIGVGAVGVTLVVRGLRQKFVEDFDGAVGTGIRRLGLAGYVAKGVALILVGLLFCWASIAFDPNKAGGTGSALQELRKQPFSRILLTLAAAGIASFGLFCFAWARRAKI